MKTKRYIALMFLIAGTNIFTFATSRYWTTQHVLTRAQERVELVLKKEGLYKAIYPADRIAIGGAGGNYRWWNTGLSYWGAGTMLTVVGLLLPFVSSRKPASQTLE